jgi:hypothetical protein
LNGRNVFKEGKVRDGVDDHYKRGVDEFFKGLSFVENVLELDSSIMVEELGGPSNVNIIGYC